MSRKRSLPHPHPHPLPLLGALAAGFGLATLASAQTTPTADPAPPDSAQVMPVVRAKAAALREGKQSLQAVTTAIGKGQQELRDIPQSLTVVTEKLIDDRHLDTLKEALHNTAGISFQAAEGGEEDIRLRGFSLSSTGDIFVDGIRDPAFYERDTFNYDRLEVLRGSASMLFGRGSTGGAVNQVNKAPLIYGRNEVALTLGTAGYLRGTVDLSRRLGENSALRINAMGTHADGGSGGGGNRLDKQGLAASLGLGIGSTDEVTASLYYLNNHNGIAYGMPWVAPSAGSTDRVLVPVGPSRTYGAASDINDGSARSATLAHTHRFGAAAEWKTVLRVGRYARDLRASAIRFCVRTVSATGVVTNPECPSSAPTLATLSDATILTRGNNTKIQDLDTLNLQSDVSAKFRALGLRHHLLAGLDAAHEDFNNDAGSALAKPKTTLGTPDDGRSVDESLRVISRNRSFDAKALGVYAQDLLQLNPEWKLLAGLRWDRFSGRYSTPVIAAAAAAERSRSDGLWSKRLGLLYQPGAFASWHLSYGTSFNTSGDTYQYDALGSNTPPEGSVNYELGGKFDLLDGRLSLRAALFKSIKTNERNRDETSVNASNYVLSGQRHASGLELDIAGRIQPGWEVFASYAFIPEARIDAGSAVNGLSLQGEAVGSRPGLTPRHSGTVWSTYQWTPSWRLGAGLNARSSMAPQLVTSFAAPHYLTADLMAEYSVGDLSYKLNLSNVTNQLYADMLYRGHYIPGKGRTLQLTGSYRF